MMPPVPALPVPAGPDAKRAQFYREVSAAFEFMALWHSLSVQQQYALRDAVQAAAAQAYKGRSPA